MKLGLGLYRSLLTPDYMAFAKQAGATHLVVHLVDYFAGATPVLETGPAALGWGITRNQHKPWTYDELVAIKKQIEAAGLTWEAIENFDPSHWYDILLDGPERKPQMEALKRTIQAVGKAGIVIQLDRRVFLVRFGGCLFRLGQRPVFPHQMRGRDGVFGFGIRIERDIDPDLGNRESLGQLKRIVGISPKLEQRLNDAGVFHYWQLADLDADQTKALDRKLRLKGQVETEKWAEQAKKLVESAAV